MSIEQAARSIRACEGYLVGIQVEQVQQRGVVVVMIDEDFNHRALVQAIVDRHADSAEYLMKMKKRIQNGYPKVRREFAAQTEKPSRSETGCDEPQGASPGSDDFPMSRRALAPVLPFPKKPQGASPGSSIPDEPQGASPGSSIPEEAAGR